MMGTKVNVMVMTMFLYLIAKICIPKTSTSHYENGLSEL